MTTIYSHPENYGCELIHTMSCGSGYDFALVIVLADTANRRFLYSSDSGCSCPEPFERQDMSTMDILDKFSWDSFVKHTTAFAHARESDMALDFCRKVARTISDWDWDEHPETVPNPFL